MAWLQMLSWWGICVISQRKGKSLSPDLSRKRMWSPLMKPTHDANDVWSRWWVFLLLKLKRSRNVILRTAFNDKLGVSLVPQLVKYPPTMQEILVQSLSREDTLEKRWATHASILERPWFDSWVGKIHWRRDRLPMPIFLGFLNGSAGKESTCNAGDLGSNPGLGRSSGRGHDNPLQCSCLENPMDRGLPSMGSQTVTQWCIHVSIPASQLIPSPPLVSVCLFSVSVSLLILCKWMLALVIDSASCNTVFSDSDGVFPAAKMNKELSTTNTRFLQDVTGNSVFDSMTSL